jgi:hypothetical protein
MMQQNKNINKGVQVQVNELFVDAINIKEDKTKILSIKAYPVNSFFNRA